MRLGIAGVAVCTLLPVACRPDTVALEYRFIQGTHVTYVLDAHARATWELAGGLPGTGSYDVSFAVAETIESVDDSGAVVSVEMEPTSVIERGLPSPGNSIRSFVLRLTPRGQVVRVLEVQGIRATDLSPEELAFIGTFRPPLPAEPVALTDSWRSRQELELASVFQQLTTVGQLDGLSEDSRGELAHIGFAAEGPVVWTTELPQGNANLTGETATTGTTVLDLSDGLLRSAEARTEGRFGVRVLPSGEVTTPIRGELTLDLAVHLTRVAG